MTDALSSTAATFVVTRAAWRAARASLGSYALIMLSVVGIVSTALQYRIQPKFPTRATALDAARQTVSAHEQSIDSDFRSPAPFFRRAPLHRHRISHRPRAESARRRGTAGGYRTRRCRRFRVARSDACIHVQRRV